VWNFLEPYIIRYDGAIFSSPSLRASFRFLNTCSNPSIDSLSDKNRELEPEFIDDVVHSFRIERAAQNSDADLALRSS
jgi:hypothetical protein